MNPNIMLVTPPLPVSEPRGSVVAARLALALQAASHAAARVGRKAWQALEEQGRKRAERELRVHGLSLSALAARAAVEAAEVRALADQHARTDPGFAADLRAAALRHESLYGVDEALAGAVTSGPANAGAPPTSTTSLRGTPSCRATR